MTRSLGLALAVFAAGSVGVVAQQSKEQGGAAPEVQTSGFLHDDLRLIDFPKPVGWKFAARKSREIPNENLGSVAALEFTARTVAFGNIECSVWILNGSSPTLRLQAIFEKHGKLKAGQALDNKYELSMEPVPHASYRFANEPHRSYLMVHRRAAGRPMTITFEMPNKMLAKARATLVQLATKVEVHLPLWPVRAKGYEYEPESGFELAFPAGLEKKRRVEMHRIVKAAVKAFVKDHAEPGGMEGEPVVIYVENEEWKRAELMATEHAVGFGCDVGMRRIVTPVVYEDNRGARAKLVAQIYEYLLFSLYPRSNNLWLHWGEQAIGRMRAECGKPLPRVPDHWLANMQRVRLSFEEVTTKDKGVAYADAAAWIAYLRLGPSKYRKAYSAYLEELRTGDDPIAAKQALRKVVDNDKLWRDARKLLGRKLKEAK